jgi:hypothetical protein
MGRKPLHLMASVTCRWASPLNEGLGFTLRSELFAYRNRTLNVLERR